MTTFKISIPSQKFESGFEVTRWNPRVPNEQITMDLLIKRLREIIDTPTTGYIVQWTDGQNSFPVETNEDLQRAILHFASYKTPVERCVRLKAEPKDTLDLFTALELMCADSDAQNPTDEDHDASEHHDLGISDALNETCSVTEPKEFKEIVISEVKQLDFESFEQERIRRIMSRLCVVHQQSVTIAPRSSGEQRPKHGIQLFNDHRDHRSHVPPNQEKKTEIPHEQLNPPEEVRETVCTSQSSGTQETGDASQVTNKDELGRNLNHGKLSNEDIDTLSRQLYMMGFRFDEKVLRRVIKTRRGNVNKIIDDLSQMQE